MINDLQELGINLKGRTSGTIKTLCPECSHTRKKKNDPCLFVNIDNGIYQCYNCEWHGVIKKESHTKHYEVPVVNNSELSDKALNWIVEQRKISKATVMRFGLFSEGREIGFPYYENGKIVHVKYRSADKKFRSSANTKMTAFGMQLEFDFKKPLIICEGEFDAMSFYEAGYMAVSCPNGANSFTWFDNCNEWIDNFDSVIIAYDNDEKGIQGRNELARRIGFEKCSYFEYGQFKDANDLLIACKNENQQWKIIFDAYFDYIKPFPLSGIVTVSDLRSRIMDLRIAGYPKGEKTGYSKLDEIITWAPGQLTVITGIPSHGKSEFIDQLIVKLIRFKWLVFSPENMPEEAHLSKIIEKYAAKPFFKLEPEELNYVMDSINDDILFFDIEEVKSIEDIMKTAKMAVRQKGIKGIVIDPYSRIEHRYGKNSTETEYVREILDKLSLMARQLQVHVILVAHPTKMSKTNGEFDVPNLYSISGSAHFYNTADNGITIYRRARAGIQDSTEVHVQKVRYKWTGQAPGLACFEWDKETGIYKEEF